MIVVYACACKVAMIMKNRNIFSAIVFSDRQIAVSIDLDHFRSLGFGKLREALVMVSSDNQLVKSASVSDRKRADLSDRPAHALLYSRKFIRNNDRGPVFRETVHQFTIFIYSYRSFLLR